MKQAERPGRQGMTRKLIEAVAYLRTSSAANIGSDKDSETRQRVAIDRFAAAHGYRVVAWFYDQAVSGADPVESRPGFAAMLDRIEGNGVRVVLVEDPSRFARAMTAYVTGVTLLKARGVEAMDSTGNSLTDPADEMQKAMMDVAMVFSELEKARLVRKLKAARDRKRAATGRCEGRKPVPVETVLLAKKLSRKPRGKARPSLRAIATELAAHGHVGPSGGVYGPESVKRMLDRASAMP